MRFLSNAKIEAVSLLGVPNVLEVNDLELKSLIIVSNFLEAIFEYIL